MRKFLSLLVTTTATVSLFAQINTELIGELSYADDMSNVWGWTAPGGEEYVIAGTFDGTSIVDITDPSTPVEIQFINGANSTWRQMGVWSHYAYVVNESNDGLLCIDLSTLPATGVADFTFTNIGMGLQTGHILYCDEGGTIYIFGSNLFGGSTVMLDATANPMDPPFLGATDTWYVHHGYAENDTLWESNIYQGWFSVWDVTDKSAPVLLATQDTPGSFTHNVILMDNGTDLFTTDEVTNGSLAAYDVSDLSDIQFKGEFRPTPGSNSIPHYAWDIDHFVTTGWYRDGLVVTDATYPEAQVLVAHYDTSPLSGNGFNGAWGVYPYFPSGIVAVTDIEQGLFLLGVDYVDAAYLNGTVTDADAGTPVFDVDITVSPDPALNTTSSIIGGYITGTVNAGLYDVTYSKAGYVTHVESGVELVNGEVVTVDVELEPLVSFPFTGQIVDQISGAGIPGADVLIENAGVSFTAVTDASGNFVIPSIFEGTYSIYAGHWGHVTDVLPDEDINAGSSIVMELARGYYDDFLFDFDWTTASTASSGDWVKADPVGTEYGPGEANPGDDVDSDFGIECFTTGNGGGSAGTDDVDDGTVTLTTPTFDLTGYANPYLSYYKWFFNNGGAGGPANDSLKVVISNGTDEVLIDLEEGLTAFAFWTYQEFKIADFITPTANMQVSFVTGDLAASGHIVEAAIDVFFVFDSLSSAPVAGFTSGDISGCSPQVVNFTDLSTDAAAWEWSFPGGTPATSTLANPVVTYTSPGTYDVALTVTNALGSNTIIESDYITVFESPSATATAGAGSATVTATGGTPPYSFLWSDGQTEETAVGLSIGSYDVTVTDANGCSAVASVEVTQPSAIQMLADGLSVEAFPNPAEDILQVLIEDTNNSTARMMEIYDAKGSMVHRALAQNGNNAVDCSAYASGLYTVRLHNNGQFEGSFTFVKK